MGTVCTAGSPRRRGAALEETGILLVPTDMAKALSNTSEMALRIHRSLKRPLRPLLVASMQGAPESFRVTFRSAEVTRNHEKALKTGSRRAFMSLLARARLHERLRGGAGGGARAESRCGRAARRLASNYALNDNATV